MRNHSIINQKGFTLVEVLIAIAIIGLAVGLWFSIYFFMNDFYAMGTERSQVQRNTRIIDTLLRKEMRNIIALSTEQINDNDIGGNEELGELKLENNGDSVYLHHNERILKIGESGSDIKVEIKQKNDSNRLIFQYEIISIENEQENRVTNNSILLNNIYSNAVEDLINGEFSLKDNTLYYILPSY